MQGEDALFLDDCPARTAWARRVFRGLTTVATADHAIERLAARPWGLVLLDHDLVGTYQDPAEPNTGSAVVRWIVANRPAIGLIVVHSLNAGAANQMVADLRASGYSAHYCPVTYLHRVLPEHE
jgi:hypothetical protein